MDRVDHGESEFRRRGTNRWARDDAAVPELPADDESWIAFGIALSEQSAFERPSRGRATESELGFRQVVDMLPDTFIACRQGVVAYLNTSGAMLIGYASGQEAIGVPLVELMQWPMEAGGAWEPARAVAADGDAVPTRARIRKLDGTFVDVEVLGVNLEFQDEQMLLLIARDITSRVRREEHVRRMAFHDPLTGLPNRTLLMDRLEHAITTARRSGGCFAVAFVDLDGFKEINDSLGHHAGDLVLKEVAGRFLDRLREEDTIARQGGDEFTVLARLVAAEDAEALALRLLSAVVDDVEVAGRSVRVGASVGVAVYPDDGQSARELLNAADAAMYRAKNAGGSSHQVGARPLAPARVRERSDGPWRNVIAACAKGELTVLYRPLFDARVPGYCGIEAVPFWGGRSTGLVAVSDIVPVPAQRRMPDSVLEWLFTTACASARLLQDEGYEFGHLSIRLNARQFTDERVVPRIIHAMRRSEFDPCRLEIEVTETLAVAGMDVARSAMAELSGHGVRVATDCLASHVQARGCPEGLPIQALRIGPEFVEHLDSDSGAAAIVDALIDLCAELGVDVVAEGVDTLSQLRFLRARGCFIYQGDLVGGVVSLKGLRAALRTRVGLLADLMGS